MTTITDTENIADAKRLVKFYMEKDIPVFVHGAPGIGKSAIFKQIAKEEKIGLIDIRISTLLPEDVTGIPVPDMENMVAKWLRADFWPNHKRDGKRGIILFDECSDAPKPLQSCIYKVVLDRYVGNTPLAEGWWPAAAGNRREDKAAAQSISTALANRFAHITVHADVEAWWAWANLNSIDPRIMAFIKFRPNMLHTMEGTNELAFATPRSWEMASKVMDAPDDLLAKAMMKIVGAGVTGEFIGFMRTLTLPDFEDIIKNPKRTMIPEDPSSRYALTAMLAQYVKKENFAAVMTYIERDEFGSDFGTCTVLDAAKRDVTLCDTKTFRDWAIKHKDIRLV